MLKSLRIQDLATIENVDLEFNDGFSILTGETGAGKSIIIDGLRLILGEKGASDMVRTGKKHTSIEAVFLTPPKTKRQESRNELLIQRMVSGSGTGKAYLDGILVPLKKLAEHSNGLADIYGQNDHIFLRKIEYQLDFLDYYGQTLELRRNIAALARELKSLFRERDTLLAQNRDKAQRLDFLQYQIKEIDEAELIPDEEERLRSERELLKNASQIEQLIAEAMELSSGADTALSPTLARLGKALAGLAPYEPVFKESLQALEQFSITVNDLSDYLIRFRDRQESSPDKLDKIEERLSLIESLKRKYGSTIHEIISYLEKIRSEYKRMNTSSERLEELDRIIEDQFKAYTAGAKSLSEKRYEAAAKLEKELEREIGLLGMLKSRIQIRLKTTIPERGKPEHIKESGTEEIEILISPNPGESLKPLRRIASGGELSRIMLAIKAIGKESERRQTMVFDEIDSGIGGKVAESVARKLNSLSKDHQVICITHLPQIASFAAHHYLIEKSVKNGRTFTTVKKLSLEERIEEIARLISGSRITPTALKNAREMLLHNQGAD